MNRRRRMRGNATRAADFAVASFLDHPARVGRPGIYSASLYTVTASLL